MEKNEISKEQIDAAKKSIEWMELSKPSVAAREIGLDVSEAQAEDVPDGIALPPHERDCGRSHPINGTNHEDLREWCGEHEV